MATDNDNEKGEHRSTGQTSGTGFFAVVGSVFSAAFGVQSSRNRKRDFEQGRPIHFIVGGIIGTVVFIALVLFAVMAVLP